jgi:acetylornithine deacetylase/succinyl-diaminopimelate desuccinylase-like protein
MMPLPGDVVELCQALVRIPSVNPSGTPGIAKTGEKECAEYQAEFLRAIGAEVEMREVLPDRPNVIGKFPTDRPGKPKLLLAPHTDTVSIVGMKIDPFGAELREGKLWGRGASDTKGPMASMLWGLHAIGPRVAKLGYEIWYAGLVGEEAGQHGAHALAKEEHFDFVVAGEPTSLDVVYTHKGCTNLRLTTRGKAVHAARPELGENAIYKMAEVIRFINQKLVPEMRRYSHPVLGHSTISVGTITGGSKTNIVPDICEATVDIRTVPTQNTPEFTERLTERLRVACSDLDVRAGHSTPLLTNPSHPVIKVLESIGAKPVGAPWFCDAAVFARDGTPAIALGPGSITQAHTEDEWIEIDALERGGAFFAQFLASL